MIRRALEILRNDGPVALYFRVLGQTVYRRLLVVETDLTTASFAHDPRCRWLRPDEAGAYARFHRVIPVEEVLRRLAAGQRCFVLVLPDGGIAHGIWVALGPAWVEYLQMTLPLTPRDAYLFQSFTAVEHRGRRHATAALRALKHALAQEGVERTVGCVQPDRTGAYPPAFRGGARPTAYVGWIGIGSWRRAFRRTTSRYPVYAPTPKPDPMESR
jgi:hypothetical protein